MVDVKKFVHCPKCGNQIPENLGFITWCECGWNLDPLSQDETESNFLNRYAKQLNRRRGEALFRSVNSGLKTDHPISLVGGIFNLLSFLIMLTNILFLGIGLILITNVAHVFWQILLGAFFVSLAWLARPKLSPIPDEVLSNEEFKTLHELVAQIAEDLGFRGKISITLSDEYNASVSRCGILQKPVLEIGIPLFLALTPQEKVALISHEVGHLVNSDHRRGILGYIGLQTLSNWINILHPDQIWPEDYDNIFGLIAGIIFNLARFILAMGLLSIYNLLVLIDWSSHHKAEYRADILGATISGRSAYQSLLRKLSYSPSFDLALQKATLSKDEKDFFKEFEKLNANTPDREMLRRDLLSEKHFTSIDISHPPTSYRIKIIDKAPGSGSVLLDNERERKILLELASPIEKINTNLIKSYESYLYGF